MPNQEQLIYGLHAVQSVLKHKPHTVTALLHDKQRRDERLQKLLDLAANQKIACTPVSKKQLTEKSNTEKHQGILILVQEETHAQSLDELLSEEATPLVLVLDSITDPHNLGACLRSADAAGVTCVVYPKDKSVGLTSTVRKVACGAAETIPTFAVTNLARTLDELKNKGLWLIGAAGEADSSFYEMDLKGPVAIVMGAEGKGLRRLTRETCDFLAKLPMAGSVSSLNVSVATGICLFEAVRQRQT